MSREPERDGWLGSTLRRSPALPTDVCLDAETLAAWADGGLTTQVAAAVELHVSNCSRCMAVVAAMERSAPVPSPLPAWTPARLFRWLVPLTAAATAIAIWVVVPDRPITPEQQSVTLQESQAMRARADEAVPQNEALVPEQRTLKENPAPGTQNQEPPTAERLVSGKDLEVRDESRRERASAKSLRASAGAAADAPPEAAAAPAAPSTAAARFVAPADAPAETTTARGSAFNSAAPSESIDSSNPLVRWRVVAPASIERSTDGGKTWTSATPLPGESPTTISALSVVAVRGVDADRAVVRTSDGREFYTTDGGRSWTAVQENSKAPF